MVAPLVGQIASGIIRRAVRPVVQKYFKDFGRYDRQLHQRLFGRSGGRGFRHGRDAGLAGGSLFRTEGDSGLDARPFQPGYTPRKFNETRGRRKFDRRTRRCRCRYPNRSSRR